MRRTLKALEGVRDDRGRLGRLLLVGGSELLVFFFQAEDGIRDQPRSRGLGDVYKRQTKTCTGEIKAGDLVVKAWDNPPFHLYCAKRL